MQIKREIPTLAQTLVFKSKTVLFQTKRAAENFLNKSIVKHSAGEKFADFPVRAESKTALWTETAAAEKFLSAGKIHNLRLAVKKLNDLEIPAGAVFSFWRQIGKTSRLRGYVVGRELREGCLIPNVGGGLCQLSNALYDAALEANFEIVERHAHSQIVPGSLAERGRDATVFWNYVDLRFKSKYDFRIEACLDAENLTVRFKSDAPPQKTLHQISRRARSEPQENSPNNCATCGVEECFRAVKMPETNDFGATAFLLDEFSPEHDEYVQQAKTAKDFLFVALDGKRFKKSNYAWNHAGFARTRQSFLIAVQRSYRSRKLASQGAARQNNLLSMSEKLARSYAKRLTYDVTHVVAAQNLLPYLWREGVLGGRTFDVLMTNLPLEKLQARLDFAKSLHSESQTLGDFRAENSLLEAEMEALKNARRIVTPHTEIAALFPGKAVLLDWKLPAAADLPKTKNPKPIVVLPASTVGRKGVYELREALRGLDCKLITFGANLEGENFWRGFETEPGNSANGWLEKADLVVLPAFVEHKPRLILKAAAHGIPVIASKACGLENVGGIETIETGNVKELRAKLQFLLAQL